MFEISSTLVTPSDPGTSETSNSCSCCLAADEHGRSRSCLNQVRAFSPASGPSLDFPNAVMAIASVQPKILLAALLLSVWLGQFVYFFCMQPLHNFRSRSPAGNPVHSFDWKSVAPELAGVIKVMNECVEEITTFFHVGNMAALYTCDPQNVDKMKQPGQCVEDGIKHYNNIVSLNASSMTPEFFAQYDHFENEDRGHGKLAREKCGNAIVDVERERFEALLGSQIRVELQDRSPCHSSYSFSLLDSSERADQSRGGKLIGKTHHFGSISISKHSAWGKKLQDAIVSALGRRRLKYDSAQRNMRGFYWYPPYGFTEWHTDSRQVEGWRLYIVKLLTPGESGFALYDSASGKAYHLRDQEGLVNMFKVEPQQPLWHAVFSSNTQRFTVGIAVSDTYAELILKRMQSLK